MVSTKSDQSAVQHLVPIVNSNHRRPSIPFSGRPPRPGRQRARRSVYTDTVRRFPALVLLLVAFSLSLISPLLLAATPKELPACCRRDGKHHCAKQMAQPAPDGIQIAALSTCPLFPAGKTTPAPTQTSTAPPALISSNVALPVQPAPAPQPPQPTNQTARNPHQQRGPPSLVS